MKPEQMDERLRADCHHLGSLPTSELLLNRNAALPWFILVPDTQLQDLLDLPMDLRESVMADCAAVSSFIKQTLGFDKVNFAGLGNVVPQMHLHVIGRRMGDVCWPQPVWGNLPDGGSYTIKQLREWQDGLSRRVAFRALELT